MHELLLGTTHAASCCGMMQLLVTASPSACSCEIQAESQDAYLPCTSSNVSFPHCWQATLSTSAARLSDIQAMLAAAEPEHRGGLLRAARLVESATAAERADLERQIAATRADHARMRLLFEHLLGAGVGVAQLAGASFVLNGCVAVLPHISTVTTAFPYAGHLLSVATTGVLSYL